MSAPLAVLVLAGLAGVPAALLWTGHGFRTFSRRSLGAWRGAVVGYGASCGLVGGLLLAPPHLWPPSSAGMGALLATGLLAGPILGAVAGAWRGRGDG